MVLHEGSTIPSFPIEFFLSTSNREWYDTSWYHLTRIFLSFEICKNILCDSYDFQIELENSVHLVERISLVYLSNFWFSLNYILYIYIYKMWHVEGKN